MKTYLNSLSADELARELDEPQYDPRPTVAALGQRLGECHDQRGADLLFEAYHRLVGWFSREAKDPASIR